MDTVSEQPSGQQGGQRDSDTSDKRKEGGGSWWSLVPGPKKQKKGPPCRRYGRGLGFAHRVTGASHIIVAHVRQVDPTAVVGFGDYRVERLAEHVFFMAPVLSNFSFWLRLMS